MALVEYKELFGSSGTISTSGSDYQRTFLVITDDSTDGAGFACASIPVSKGDHYDTGTESDTTSFATKISAVCTANDGLQWLVTVDYTAVTGGGNPLLAPVDEDWKFTSTKTVVEKDKQGKPYVNSANDPFLTGKEVDVKRLAVTFTYNAPSFNKMLAVQVINCVNTDVFLGFQPDQAKLNDISAKKVFDETYGSYYSIKQEIEFNLEGWNASEKVLDCGMNRLAQFFNVGEKLPIEVGGTPATVPQLLDGHGHLLLPGNPPVYLQFQPYNKISFAFLRTQ